MNRQQQPGNNGSQRYSSPGSASQGEGEYCYLGYPPRTKSVRYNLLVEKLPGLLRLIQGAHRIGEAASSTNSKVDPQGMRTGFGQSLDCRGTPYARRLADIQAASCAASTT